MGLGSLLSFLSTDLAIDLGTANTCVYAKGRGIVVNEPSMVAVNKVTGRVEAVGTGAKEMLGRTPGNIVAIKPMKDGVIADFDVTEKMLTYFIKKAHNGNVWVRPRIIIGVPSEITQVEKRAVKDSAYRAKASEVHLIEEAMAAAIGGGGDVRERGDPDRHGQLDREAVPFEEPERRDPLADAVAEPVPLCPRSSIAYITVLVDRLSWPSAAWFQAGGRSPT